MITIQQIKQKLSSATLCIIIVISWLAVLTLMVINATSTIRTMSEKIVADEHNPKLTLMEIKLAELTAQLENSKTNPTVTQLQLSNVQQELRTRIQALSEQHSELASTSQLDRLKKQLQQLQAELQQTQTNLVTKSVTAVVTKETKTNPTIKRTTANKVSNQPPFKILSVELRGGERVLSVIPINVKDKSNKTLSSALLLTNGQSIAHWQLESINEHTAVFKVGSTTRRLTIATP